MNVVDPQTILKLQDSGQTNKPTNKTTNYYYYYFLQRQTTLKWDQSFGKFIIWTNLMIEEEALVVIDHNLC